MATVLPSLGTAGASTKSLCAGFAPVYRGRRGNSAGSITLQRTRRIGLCHGAARLGHIFNRLYQATGDEPLANAARFWFHRTLEMRHPERGIAGYAAFMPERSGEERWVDSPGLLEGAAGVALALLAATTSVEPNWDRMLIDHHLPAIVTHF